MSKFLIFFAALWLTNVVSAWWEKRHPTDETTDYYNLED